MIKTIFSLTVIITFCFVAMAIIEILLIAGLLGFAVGSLATWVLKPRKKGLCVDAIGIREYEFDEREVFA